jgi:2-dehydropantoate 2-reductase
LRIAVLGAGGVGGYFGARLGADGNDVTFVARGAHAAAMRERGLKVLSPMGALHLAPVMLHDDWRTTGLVDIVLVAVKMYGLEEAAATVKPLLSADTAVVPFQNGVEVQAILERVLGRRYVCGGAAYISAAIEAPGVIRHTGERVWSSASPTTRKGPLFVPNSVRPRGPPLPSFSARGCRNSPYRGCGPPEIFSWRSPSSFRPRSRTLGQAARAEAVLP